MTDMKPLNDTIDDPLNSFDTSHFTNMTDALFSYPSNPLYQAEKGLISFFDKTDRTSNMSFMNPMDYGLKETSPDTLKRVLSKSLEGQDQEIIDRIVNHFNERKDNPRTGIKQSYAQLMDSVMPESGSLLFSGIKSLFSGRETDAYAPPKDIASNIMDTANEAGVDNQTIKEVVATQPSRPSMR